MFFILSKILWKIFAPLTFITLMIVGGYLFRDMRWGQRILKAGVCLLVALGFFPIGNNILAYQENRYPVMVERPARVDGIIVLGGAIDFRKSLERGQGQLNENAPRMTEMIALMTAYPNAKIVFTGGNGGLDKSLSSESKEVDKLFKHMGIDTSRIIYEGQSRNTFENMKLSKELVKPQEDETWLLVTSAFHMMRSEKIFNSNGWRVTPYPAGYLTTGQYKLIPSLEVIENMYKLQIAVKEMIGIMAYILTGKINLNEVTETLPMPSSSPDSRTGEQS